VARETVDDLRPFALGGKISPIAVAKVVAGVLAVIVPALVGAVSTYRIGAQETQERVQSSKNKSEAGYQVTRQAVEALEKRMLLLEQGLRKVEAPPKPKGARPAHRGGPLPPAPPPPVAVKQLPSNLDLAERQVYRGVAAPSTPAPTVDAAPP
jgi:hypothetical protein